MRLLVNDEHQKEQTINPAPVARCLSGCSSKSLVQRVVVGLVLLGIVVFAVKEALLAGYFDQAVEGKVMVIYYMPQLWWAGTLLQGMFSDFAAVLGALKYAEDHGAAGVRVVYDSPLYADPERGNNWWAYFFEPTMVLRPELFLHGQQPQETHFNRIFARFGQLGSFVPQIIGKPPRDRPYPMTSATPVAETHRIAQTYIKMKPDFKKMLEEIAARYLAPDDFLIGIHFRGTDKTLIYPYVSPSYAVFEFYVEEVLKAYQPHPEKWKLYVATDDTDFFEWAQRRWPGRAFAFELNTRLSSKDAAAQQGGVHKSVRFKPYEKALSGMVDMLMVSRARHIIKNRSSLSDTSIVMHPGPTPSNFTFILGPSHPVYHYGIQLPQPPSDVEGRTKSLLRGIDPATATGSQTP